MAARKAKARVSAPAWGLTLCEFRGAYRAVQRATWWQFFAPRPARTRAERRKWSVIAVMALAAPAAWHTAHPGRLDGRHRDRVNQWLTLWRPIYRAPIDGIHPEAK